MMRAKYLLFLLPDIDVTDKSIQLRAKFFFQLTSYNNHVIFHRFK